MLINVRKLDSETFTAAARAFHVRIVEHEFGTELIFNVIHFGTEQSQLSFRIDQHFDAVLIHLLVHLLLFFGIVQNVCQPVTASLLHSDSQCNAIRLFGH